MAAPKTEPTVALLAEDPDLAAGLHNAEAQRASAQLLVPLIELAEGDAHLLTLDPEPPDLVGLLVLEGALLRQVRVARAVAAEVVGAGDLIHPGDMRATDLSPVKTGLRWTVLKPARLAVLDGGFVAAAAEWPDVLVRVALRAMWRIHGLALAHAISHQRKVADRVLLLLWHFAQRWGTVSTRDVTLDLPLTHETIATMVGARRPSVTSAIKALEERNLVTREAQRSWLLPSPIATTRDGLPELNPSLTRQGPAS